ncbi:MAG: Subtilisin DY [Candidatus Heimdallarchaeota archaeon LC_3]|nr:MAG: Subtilisin DY [Candidatus Heimdallarchaeota archaeon LC_3]
MNSNVTLGFSYNNSSKIVNSSNNIWFYDIIDFNPKSSLLPIINTSITLALIDSGFNQSLDSINGNTFKNIKEIPDNKIDDDQNGYVDDYYGFDFVLNRSINPIGLSYTSHSTLIAHLLAGINKLNNQIIGMLPNVSLLNIRILDSNNILSEHNWTIVRDSLRYAIKMKSDIILLSSEFLTDPPIDVKKAFEDVKDADITLVTIAGNSNTRVSSYPALLGWSITVGAVENSSNDGNFSHADYSNVGQAVDIVAPGTDITSYDINGKLISNSGTSFAAPFVAGTAAWIKIMNNSLNITQIKNIIVNTASSTGDCYSNGAGILNVTNALLVTQGKLPLIENPDVNKTNCSENTLFSNIKIFAYDSFLSPLLILVFIAINKKFRKKEK